MAVVGLSLQTAVGGGSVGTGEASWEDEEGWCWWSHCSLLHLCCEIREKACGQLIERVRTHARTHLFEYFLLCNDIRNHDDI